MDEQNKSMNERWPGGNASERGYAGSSRTPTDSTTSDPATPGIPATPGSAPDRGYSADEPGTDRRTREIRSEIDRTRAEMGETIDAIEDRLRPRNVVNRAARSVRDATVGRFERASGRGSAYESDPYDGRGSGLTDNAFVDRLREHPVATAFAAGSIAWLAFADRSRRSTRSRAIYGSRFAGEPYLRETTIQPEMTGEAEYDDGRHASGYAESARGYVEEAGHRWSARAGATGSRLRGAASDAQYRARRATEQNPMMTGAIAAAAGLAIGLTLPETRRENELMGDTRDSMLEGMKERASETAREVAGKVQETVTDVQHMAASVVSGGSAGSSSKESEGTAQESQGTTNRESKSKNAPRGERTRGNE